MQRNSAPPRVQIASGKLKRITIAVSGDIVTGAIELMKAGVLKGVLSHSQPEPVNFINAPFLAEELGLAVGRRVSLRGAITRTSSGPVTSRTRK